MVRLLACVVPLVLLFACFTTIVPVQTAGGNPATAPAVADRHAASEPFDVNAAVDAYLAKMPPRRTGSFQCLFRRRLLAALVGFPLDRSRNVDDAEVQIVDADA